MFTFMKMLKEKPFIIHLGFNIKSCFTLNRLLTVFT